MWIDFKLTNSTDETYLDLINIDHFISIKSIEGEKSYLLMAVGDSATPNIVLYTDKNELSVRIIRDKFKEALQSKQLLQLKNGYIQSL